MAPADIIIVGIDLGTTYSGVAWTRAKSNTISLVTSWESNEDVLVTEAKVPSKIFFENGTTEASKALWGFSTPSDKDVVEWFKIMQLEWADVPEHIRDAPNYMHAWWLLCDLNQTPSWVLSAFMKGMWNHALQSIERSLGASCLKSCDVHFVVTIPASWPHYIKERYTSAATAAGMLDRRGKHGCPKLDFISEPEAAAIATLQDVTTQPDIKKGDTFIICDAGGGTADVITYMLDDLKLREAIEGEGVLRGAMNLDLLFGSLVESLVDSNSWKAVDGESKRKFFKYEWHNGLKVGFQDGHADRQWKIDLPHGCVPKENQLKRKGAIILSSEEIKTKVFEPVVSPILDLLQRQQQAATEKYGKQPSHIILVGGFGRNRYLHSRISSTFPDMAVLQSEGQDPWTAICRGAVLYGLSKTDQSHRVRTNIGSRVARHSYGVIFNQVWDELRHIPEQKYWDDLVGEYRARGQMGWFIRKGDDIDAMNAIERNYHRNFTGEVGRIHEPFHISSEDVAGPYYDSTVQELCTVQYSKSIRARDLPKRTGHKGQKYRRMDYSIRMTVSGPSIEFKIIHKGEDIGQRNMEVAYSVSTSSL